MAFHRLADRELESTQETKQRDRRRHVGNSARHSAATSIQIPVSNRRNWNKTLKSRLVFGMHT